LTQDTLLTGDLASVPFDFDARWASIAPHQTLGPVPSAFMGPIRGPCGTLYDKFDLRFQIAVSIMSQPDDYAALFILITRFLLFIRLSP